MSVKDRNLWCLTLVLVAIALSASIWATFGIVGCGSCDGTAASRMGNSLARAGVGYYAVLLGAGLLAGPSRVFFGGLLFAAGIQAALLVLLVTQGRYCPPCLAAGTAVIVGAIVSLFLEPQNLVRASFLLPAAAVAGHALILTMGLVSVAPLSGTDASKAFAEETASLPTLPGTARMTIYWRADCVYCQTLEDEIMPRLEAEFRDALQVERRSAEGLPGMPTPTIILIGQGGRRTFPGLPSAERLRAAILDVLGGDHGRQAMLPPSR